MTFQYFTENQIIPLEISAIILVAATVTFHVGKNRLALTLLFISSLGFGFFIANLDPFLILWDEQYHALVAKNMLDNPLKPTLYSTPLLDYDYQNWVGNHVWLHKQPLFLWQIALSLKVFGMNAFAVRIPSAIMHAIATIMVYRIGKISVNSSVGFYGAMFFAISYHLLELIAGKYATDHNDVAFLFYVTASFWAWFEYQHSRKSYWIILIGIFSGCAVLVKWLVGLLIYAVWTITLGLTEKRNWIKIKSYIPIFKSSAIAFTIFLPWQVYIFNTYPLEAKHEWKLASDHFFKPIENHSGDLWFHFNALKDIYGSGQAIPFLLLIGLFIFLKKSPLTLRVASLSSIVITYVFYSAAATKMTSFCIIVAPFGFLAFGALVDSILNLIKSKINLKRLEIPFQCLTVLCVCFLLIKTSKIQNYHTDWRPIDNCNRKRDLEQMTMINKISDNLKGDSCVIFNADIRLFGHIAVMFYTDFIAYDFIPNNEQIEKIKKQSYKIAILDNDSLPNYISQDTEITKIKIY